MQGCSKHDGSPATFGDVNAQNVSDLAVGTLRAVPSAPAIIARDALGIYAMTSTCTHEGCDVAPASGGSLFCPCHGSSFDANGNRTAGPAQSPLVHFAVDVDPAGNLTIHGGVQVDATTRVAVPPGLG